MALRIMLSDLWREVLLMQSDPVRRADQVARLQLDSLDRLAETSSMPDDFKHQALHEIETFWKILRPEVEAYASRDRPT